MHGLFRAAASLLSLMAVAVSSAAIAAPQGNAALTVGGAATELRTSPSSAFHLGGRADVLFLRERGRDMAIGP